MRYKIKMTLAAYNNAFEGYYNPTNTFDKSFITEDENLTKELIWFIKHNEYLRSGRIFIQEVTSHLQIKKEDLSKLMNFDLRSSDQIIKLQIWELIE